MGDHWRGRIFVLRRDHDLHTIGREHLERAGISRNGKGMRVDAEEQRTPDTLLPAVMARTCPSLKVTLKALPRCPEVPKVTRCAGTEASGTSV